MAENISLFSGQKDFLIGICVSSLTYRIDPRDCVVEVLWFYNAFLHQQSNANSLN